MVSALRRFTAALPALGAHVSDLVLETWVATPACGTVAVEATHAIEVEVRRPPTTRSELAQLTDAARAAGVQPHAMTLTCADYAAIAPGGAADPVAMLGVVTRELTRITTSAIRHRDREPGHRPWIAVYGGAQQDIMGESKARYGHASFLAIRDGGLESIGVPDVAMPTAIDVAYVGDETIEVPAGRFATQRYALRWNPAWPPADMWVHGPLALFVLMRWSLIDTRYELTEIRTRR